MNTVPRATAVAACLAMTLPPAFADAHAIAGARVFPVTLTIDDPGVADEASIPTFTVQRQPNDADFGHGYQYNIAAEFDKRITENLGVGVNGGYTVRTARIGKTQTGFQDINVTLKYQAFVNAPHEAIVSVGVIREFARTGTAHIGADQYGSTTPTVYFGKGFGDLPIPALRPVAVTGTIGTTVADRKLKAANTPDLGANSVGGVTGLAAQQFNNGYANRLVGGLSVQYSLPYLQSQVMDLGLPSFFGRLIPLVEVAYSSPAGKPSNLGTQVVYAPGVIYQAETFQFGMEALIPANRASGRFVGVVAQMHVFLDDLLPNSLGKPLFGN